MKIQRIICTSTVGIDLDWVHIYVNKNDWTLWPGSLDFKRKNIIFTVDYEDK